MWKSYDNQRIKYLVERNSYLVTGRARNSVARIKSCLLTLLRWDGVSRSLRVDFAELIEVAVLSRNGKVIIRLCSSAEY